MKSWAMYTCLAMAMAATTTLAAGTEKEVRKTLPLAPSGEVRVKTFKGSITVTAGTSAEVEVLARIAPDGDDVDEKRKVEETEVRISAHGDTVEIESDYDRVHKHWLFGFNENNTLPFVHYTIKMPRTARLTIDDYKSRTRITGLEAELRFKTYKGDARIEGVTKGVRAETYKGDIVLVYDKLAEDADLETYKGRITLKLPSDSRFDLDAAVGRRGDLNSDFTVATATNGRHRGDDTRVRGPVNGGGPRLRFETHKGTLELRHR